MPESATSSRHAAEKRRAVTTRVRLAIRVSNAADSECTLPLAVTASGSPGQLNVASDALSSESLSVRLLPSTLRVQAAASRDADS